MSTDPAIVPASFVKLSTLADGTVRVVLDIEPKDRATAFGLFEAPGAAVAVARLTDEAALAHDRRQHETSGALSDQDEAAGLPRKPSRPAAASSDPLPKQKLPSSLAAKVAMACGSPTFQAFLRDADPRRWQHIDAASDCERAAEWVRRDCGVTSRREITTGSRAAAIWHTLEADYEHAQRTGAISLDTRSAAA